ncbi:MAG: MFS transporter [Acidimicrobiales bacterium]
MADPRDDVAPQCGACDAARVPGDRHPFRWVIFGAMAGVYYAFGVMVLSIPPMITTVRDDLGISRTQMGLALGAWALIYIVTAPPAGRIVDRIGLGPSIAIGGSFVAISGFARAGAQGLGTLWIAIAIFGIGGPLISSAAPKLIAMWFGDDSERRLAIGLYTTAPALGTVTSLLLTNSVLLPALGGWREVIVVYSLLAVAATAVWSLTSWLGPPAPQAASFSAKAQKGEWKRLLESKGVRLALGLGLGVFFVNHGLASWLPNLLETDSELSAAAASNWVALSIGIGIIASMVLPRQATVDRRAGVLASVMLVMAISLSVIAVGPPGSDVVATLVLGVRAATIPLIILILMDAERVTTANMGLANGLWFSAAEIGGAAGPLVVGAISDTSGGFSAALGVLVASLVVMIVTVLAFGREEAGSGSV